MSSQKIKTHFIISLMKKIIFIFMLFSFFLHAFANPSQASRGRPEPKNPPPRMDKNDKRINSSAPKSSTLNFRGQRITIKDEPIKIINTLIEKKGKETFSVVLNFNQSINPSSVLTENIILNGNCIDSETKFVFNRRTDSVNFYIDCKKVESLELKNIESFDGKIIELLPIKL